jgi:hypothetical protein
VLLFPGIHVGYSLSKLKKTLFVNLFMAGDSTAARKDIQKPAAGPFGPEAEILDDHQTAVGL